MLRWAQTLDRPLPWRGERDPYRVLVSEVMLQQTQAGRIVRAYPVFLRRFPTVQKLAEAEAADVLRAWGGLGYNRRALNLWRAARLVVERGRFPGSVAELEALPGVGPYTARAVASFAFGADAAAVDANVHRVVIRLFGLAADTDVQPLADTLLPPANAAKWNQALMDLGAEICRSRSPRCDGCPLRPRCAWASGVGHEALHAAPAAPFRSTMRYARGRVVADLRRRRHWATMRGLGSRTGLSAHRLRAAVRALEGDGIVSRRGERVSLGPRSMRP